MYIYSILGGIMLYAGYVNRSKLYQEGINQGWNIVYYYHMTKEQISSIVYKIKKEEEDEIQEEETKILIGWDGDVETTLSWDNEQDIDLVYSMPGRDNLNKYKKFLQQEDIYKNNH